MMLVVELGLVNLQLQICTLSHEQSSVMGYARMHMCVQMWTSVFRESTYEAMYKFLGYPQFLTLVEKSLYLKVLNYY